MYKGNADGDLAKVSLVGAGLNSGKDPAEAVLKVLHAGCIATKMVIRGGIKLAVLLPQQMKDKAVRLLHERFCMPDGALTIS